MNVQVDSQLKLCIVKHTKKSTLLQLCKTEITQWGLGVGDNLKRESFSSSLFHTTSPHVCMYCVSIKIQTHAYTQTHTNEMVSAKFNSRNFQHSWINTLFFQTPNFLLRLLKSQ